MLGKQLSDRGIVLKRHLFSYSAYLDLLHLHGLLYAKQRAVNLSRTVVAEHIWLLTGQKPLRRHRFERASPWQPEVIDQVPFARNRKRVCPVD